MNRLPASLVELNVLERGGFDIPIDNLPASITCLALGNSFDQPISHFPPLLTHLTIGLCFNQCIDSLPESVTHLRIAVLGSFDQQYSRLPPNLIHLEIPKVPQGFRLPQSLVTVEVQAQNWETVFPSNLKHLIMVFNSSEALNISLPPSLESFVALLVHAITNFIFCHIA